MAKVHKLVERNRLEKITLECSDDAYDLTVTEFFELVGELYKKLTFVNDVDIKIKGVHHSIPSKIKIRPDTGES